MFALSVFLPRKGKHLLENKWICCRDLASLRSSQQLSGTLLCMKYLQRGLLAEYFSSLYIPVLNSLSSAIKVAIFGKLLLVYLKTFGQIAQ